MKYLGEARGPRIIKVSRLTLASASWLARPVQNELSFSDMSPSLSLVSIFTAMYRIFVGSLA